jgi:hypothetical protein
MNILVKLDEIKLAKKVTIQLNPKKVA